MKFQIKPRQVRNEAKKLTLFHFSIFQKNILEIYFFNRSSKVSDFSKNILLQMKYLDISASIFLNEKEFLIIQENENKLPNYDLFIQYSFLYKSQQYNLLFRRDKSFSFHCR
jgi:hypothetical protein